MTKSGRSSTTGWAVSGEQDGKVYERKLRPAEWMLLLLSSGQWRADLLQDGGRSGLEFRVGASADLESSEPLVGNAESGGENAERDAFCLSACSEFAPDGIVGGGIEQSGIDLVRDVSFEAAHDVTVGELLRTTPLEVGHRARLAVPHA